MTLAFDWPFFVLLFAVGVMSSCAAVLLGAPFMDRSVWMATRMGQTILARIVEPLFFSPIVILIYGFFTMPWYTVLISAVVDLIAVTLFFFFVLSPVVQLLRVGVFPAFLLSGVAATIAVLRYFGVF